MNHRTDSPPRKEGLLALLHDGRFAEAKAAGEALVRAQPQDAEAWNLLGVVKGALGESGGAEQCFCRAVELAPDYLKAHRNLALALISQHKTRGAIECLQAVTRLDPADAEARYSLGNLFHEEGNREMAATAYRETLRLNPHHLQAHNNLGAVYTEQGQLEEAIACYREALRLEPDHVEAHFNLGSAYHAGKRFGDAITQYKRVLALQPDNLTAQLNLGIALHAAGRLEEAEKHLGDVVRLQPSHAEAHFHLATVSRDKGDAAAAESVYRHSIALDPALTKGYIRLALLLEDQFRFQEALGCLQQARKADPRSPTVLTDLGVIYTLLDRFEEAAACHDQAIQINPVFAAAHYNRAFLHYMWGRYSESADDAKTSIRLDPNYSAASRLLSHLSLQSGNFAGGWDYYARYRSFDADKPPLPPFPLQDDLRGKRVLVGRDQGLGDELFFLRFLPQLRARGAWVAYCPDPKLASILARVPELDRIVAWGEPLKDLTYTVSVSDLPLLLGMDDASKIPAPLALSPLPERLEAMHAKLATLGPPPYVGITWRAGTKEKRKLYKEAPLSMLAEVLKPLAATVLILQRHPQAGEIEAFSQVLGRPAYDLSAANEDLEDMLALLKLLDEYVGVSNTNMHLRAGAGRTARVLVPHPPEWRWMAEGEESQWFRGFKVYRQGHDKTWENVFDKLERDVRNVQPLISWTGGYELHR